MIQRGDILAVQSLPEDRAEGRVWRLARVDAPLRVADGAIALRVVGEDQHHVMVPFANASIVLLPDPHLQQAAQAIAHQLTYDSNWWASLTELNDDLTECWTLIKEMENEAT